tara:strand:+ start:17084 stop:17308 length:225 start_codon:yes stop_codon:yes gene_type:complete
MATRKNFPGRREIRQTEATERQEARNKLTDQQQLDSLNAMFGEGNGATKERARLARNIARSQAAKPAKVQAESE